MSDSPLSLISTREDAENVIALAEAMKRAGRFDDAFKMAFELIRAMAVALEDPTAAGIGKLVELITDHENELRLAAQEEEINEADVYLWLLERAGLSLPMGTGE